MALFLWLEAKTSETYKGVTVQYGGKCKSSRKVYEWVKHSE